MFKYNKKLGFKISYEDGICLIICYSGGISAFTNYCSMASDKYVEFYNKKLVKTLQKFIKEEKEKEKKEAKIEDFEVAEDGRVIKINNKESEKQIFIVYDEAYNYVLFINFSCNYMLLYY